MRWLLVLLCACNAPLVVEDVSDLPIREWTLGLPVTGEGYLLGVIAREGNDWSTARGGAFFICHDCTLGNDKTKLDFTHTTLDTAFWEENSGIDFGHLEFDRVVAKTSSSRRKSPVRSHTMQTTSSSTAACNSMRPIRFSNAIRERTRSCR